MTAIVTGATGFIGSVLAARLASRGVRTICPVRASSPRAARLASIAGIDVVSVSSFASDQLRRALPAEPARAVFHLAATGISACDRDSERLRDGNERLLLSVLDALADRPPKRFVHVGSSAEYAPTEAPELIDETHPLAPLSLYGAAKAAAFTSGQARAAELGIEFVTLRLFSVYGVGDDPERLLPHLCARLTRGEACSLTPGEQLRDFTHVEDVVEALELAAAVDAGVYNVCSGAPIAVRDVALRVAAATGQPESLLGLGSRPYPPDEVMWLVGNPARFHAATGWRPRVELDAGIARMVASAMLR